MPVTQALARFIGNYDDRSSLGSALRRRRLAPLLTMIDAVYRVRGRVSVIDVGGRENYWNIVPEGYFEQRNIIVTIVNLPRERKPQDHGVFRFADGDGCDLQGCGDRSFDIAHSNSVLEHVGAPADMERFAREIMRVAHGYFIQTPSFWFPVEPHAMTPFFHWLPRSARLALVSRFQLGRWSKARSRQDAERIVDSARLLTRAEMQQLFDDAEITTERLWGLPKSFVAIRWPRAVEATSRSAEQVETPAVTTGS